MAEFPIKENVLGPVVIDQYIGTGDPAMLIDFKRLTQRIKASFYWKEMELLQVVTPYYLSALAKPPTPDTFMQDFKAMAYHDIGFFGDIMMESAPPILVQTYFTVIAALYSRGTKIDPNQPCPPCPPGGGTATGCQPIADLELSAAPIAALEMDESPVADLEQDETPRATLECKILS